MIFNLLAYSQALRAMFLVFLQRYRRCEMSRSYVRAIRRRNAIMLGSPLVATSADLQAKLDSFWDDSDLDDLLPAFIGAVGRILRRGEISHA